MPSFDARDFLSFITFPNTDKFNKISGFIALIMLLISGFVIVLHVQSLK